MPLHLLLLLSLFWPVANSFAPVPHQQPTDGHLNAAGAESLCSLYAFAVAMEAGEGDTLNYTRANATYIHEAVKFFKEELEMLDKPSSKGKSRNPKVVEWARRALDDALAVAESAETEVAEQFEIIEKGEHAIREHAKKALEGESGSGGLRDVLRMHCQTISKDHPTKYGANTNNNCKGVKVKQLEDGGFQIQCAGQPPALEHIGVVAAMANWNAIKPKPSAGARDRDGLSVESCRERGYHVATACTVSEADWLDHYQRAIDAMRLVVDGTKVVQQTVEDVKTHEKHVEDALQSVTTPGDKVTTLELVQDGEGVDNDAEGPNSTVIKGLHAIFSVAFIVVPLAAMVAVVVVATFLVRTRQDGASGDGAEVARVEGNAKFSQDY